MAIDILDLVIEDHIPMAVEVSVGEWTRIHYLPDTVTRDDVRDAYLAARDDAPDAFVDIAFLANPSGEVEVQRWCALDLRW